MRVSPTLAFAALALLAPALRAQDEASPIAAQIAAANAALDAIAAIPDGERTYENTVLAIDDAQARFYVDAELPGFMAQVSTDAEERERGRRAAADLENWFTELYQREALYRAVKAFAETGPALEGDAQRYLDVLLRDFRRAGMELAPEQRARLLELDLELNELGIEFRRNIDEDETVVPLTLAECAGVPSSTLDALPRASGLVLVKPLGPDANQFLGYCEVPSTREKIAVAASLRAGTRNVRVLEKLLRLRSEKAHLLGYENLAEYVTEVRMAKDAATVMAFYGDLRPKLRRKALADFAEFEAAKREHTGDPEAKLETWDLAFYSNWLKREKYAVDTQKLREYMPIEQVTEGIFGVTQDLFGLRFVDITDRARAAGRPLWHADVKLYEVHDRATGELLGEFYTDLYPRPNKYSHAAQFTLEMRKRWPDGSMTKPLVALVCNFSQPTADAPALLTHKEVETFFHEFGHCLHSILTECDMYEFSGTSVARDFVEAPSQMLENWLWDPTVLRRFARHHETGEPLSDEMLAGLIAAKNLGSGLNAETQVFYGMTDFAYHTDADGELDTTAVRNAVLADTRLFAPIENVHGQASFGHFVGYEAGYYGYLWSLVYAADMFSRFEDAGPMDPETAREYRSKVLARGGSADALELVRDFLGREPNADAFLRELGLDE